MYFDKMSNNNSTEGSPSPSPVAPNAPKFGTVIPNRIFVGGISASTTEQELHSLFSNYGNVKATKVISDRAGVSKGYGFVTFETEEEARRILQKDADNIILKDRKLNIAQAIKKQENVVSSRLQPFTRAYDDCPSTKESSQAIPNGTILYHNGIPCMYHNGMAFFITPENMYHVTQPQAATYPTLIYPQPVYVAQQQYQFQSAAPSQWTTSGQWHWASPSPAVPAASYVYSTLPPAPAATAVVSTSTASTAGANEMYHYTTPVVSAVTAPVMATGHSSMPPNTQPVMTNAYSLSRPPDSDEVTSVVEAGNMEITKSHHLKKNGGGNMYTSSPRKAYNPGRMMRMNAANLTVLSGAGDASTSRTVKQLQAQQPHLVSKTVNGVTIMAYPTAITPQMSAKDHCIGDHENLPMVTMADVGLLHSPLTGNAPLSPPQTPLSPIPTEIPNPNVNENTRRLPVLKL